MAFTLHPRLEADTLPVTESALCTVRLMNNAWFPWLILIPRREGITELTDLPAEERYQLMDDISVASEVLQRLYRPDKINVATLGNQVAMLHVHVIARFTRDAAWPHPVWGKGGEPYAEAASHLASLREAFEKPH